MSLRASAVGHIDWLIRHQRGYSLEETEAGWGGCVVTVEKITTQR
jgi:hypothetical protein